MSFIIIMARNYHIKNMFAKLLLTCTTNQFQTWQFSAVSPAQSNKLSNNANFSFCLQLPLSLPFSSVGLPSMLRGCSTSFIMIMAGNLLQTMSTPKSMKNYFTLPDAFTTFRPLWIQFYTTSYPLNTGKPNLFCNLLYSDRRFTNFFYLSGVEWHPILREIS